MNVTDKLRAEHDDIRQVVSILEAELTRIEAGESVDFDIAKDALYFLTQYPDLLHQVKLDSVYPLLTHHHPELQPSVDEIGDVQVHLKRQREELLDKVEDVTEDVVVPLDQLLDLGHRYIEAERQRLTKEESELLPYIEDRRQAQALDKALKRCHRNRLDTVARLRLESLTGRVTPAAH